MVARSLLAFAAAMLVIGCHERASARPIRYWIEVVDHDQFYSVMQDLPATDGLVAVEVKTRRSARFKRPGSRFQNFWARIFDTRTGAQLTRIDWGAGERLDPRDDTDYEGHYLDEGDGVRRWWVDMDGLPPPTPNRIRRVNVDLHPGELYLADVAVAREPARFAITDESDEEVDWVLDWDAPEVQAHIACWLEEQGSQILDPEPCDRGGGLALVPRVDVRIGTWRTP